MKLNGSDACPSLTMALISLNRGCLASAASWNSAISELLISTPARRLPT